MTDLEFSSDFIFTLKLYYLYCFLITTTITKDYLYIVINDSPVNHRLTSTALNLNI